VVQPKFSKLFIASFLEKCLPLSIIKIASYFNLLWTSDMFNTAILITASVSFATNLNSQWTYLLLFHFASASGGGKGAALQQCEQRRVVALKMSIS
jgi:hypothetical protein